MRIRLILKILLIIFGSVLVSFKVLAADQTIPNSKIKLSYFFPEISDLSDSAHFEPTRQNLVYRPSSGWETGKITKAYYGFRHTEVIIRLENITAQNAVLVQDRFLNEVKAFYVDPDTRILNEIIPKQVNSMISQKRFDQILDNPFTLYIYARSQPHGPLSIPLDISKAADLELKTGIGTGLYLGFGLFSLVICAAISLHYRHASLAFITVSILCLLVYRLATGHLLANVLPAGININNLLLQVNALAAIAVMSLYIQAKSPKHIFSSYQKLYNPYIFNSIAILIITTEICIMLIQSDEFRIKAFLFVLLPGLLAAFLACIITSATAFKKHAEQGLLLISWLAIATAYLIELSIMFGMDNSIIMPLLPVKHLPSLLYLVSVICLTFWVIQHNEQIQSLKNKNMQDMIDQLILKNKNMEINQARATDLAKSIYSQLRKPIQDIMKLAQSTKNITREEFRIASSHLEEHFKKMTILSQDLTQTLEPQLVPFNLKQLVERLPFQLKDYINEHKLQMTLEYDQLLPEYAKGDQSLLHKALLLILEHRIKSLFNGYIRIQCTRLNDARSPSVHLKIRIEDNGAAYEQSVIDQFLDKTPKMISSDFQLILARDMIQAMSGDMTIHHEEFGNVFTCRLSLGTTGNPKTSSSEDKSQALTLSNARFSHLHALIISPQTEDKLTLESALNALGIISHSAVNAQDALTTLMVENIHLVYLNLEMPQGIEIYKHLAHYSKLDDKPVFPFSRSSVEAEVTQKLGLAQPHTLPLDQSSLHQILSSYF